MPRLHHPTLTDTSVEVDEDQVEAWRAQGWKSSAAEPQPEPEPEPDIEDEQDGSFDPAEHNADEVNAYLAGADEAEAERVLDAERDGKNRKGVVGDE